MKTPLCQCNVQAGFRRVTVFVGIGVGNVIKPVVATIKDVQVDIKSTAHEGKNGVAKPGFIHAALIMHIELFHQPRKHDQVHGLL